MEIQGKIIRIVDKTTVIINLGKNHGIRASSIFNILGNPELIIDPFSKEELGLVSVVKAKVKAAQVHDKFTIASTRWSSTRLKFEANLGAQIGALFDTELVDQGELLVDATDLQPWKAKSETPVKVGDIVEVEVEGSTSSSDQADKLGNGDKSEQADKAEEEGAVSGNTVGEKLE